MAAHFGMIGLGTMGRNLLLNVADHGYEVCGYDPNVDQQKRLLAEAGDLKVTAAESLPEFLSHLATPRIIMLLVPAGKIVDSVLTELMPLVEKGDIIIDGGNTHFTDTDRRYDMLQSSGVHFIGMGVSGGEEGARRGPSMMPGGNIESYELVKEILEAIAAKSDEGPCVAYMGNKAAGHYTKMVHNGIEYAMMQLISEIYAVLKKAGELSNNELHLAFDAWNKAELQSFLVEITAAVFKQKDPETGNDLVDMILDKAKQKGTGMWTSQNAMDLNVPLPTIDIAVTMRYISALKDQRVSNSRLYNLPDNVTPIEKELLITLSKSALHFGFLIAYAQGLHLLKVASEAYNYAIPLPEVVKIWKGGCIIRSAMLGDLRKAYVDDNNLVNIISSPVFRPLFTSLRNDVKQVLAIALENDIPVAALSSALHYFDAITSEKLSANLIQAQRDFFGAHTYERIDKPGVFHTEWEG